jgi:hypothetical protein
MSFRRIAIAQHPVRKPESRICKEVPMAWTPVFTGVTVKTKFFHTFYPAKVEPAGVETS